MPVRPGLSNAFCVTALVLAAKFRACFALGLRVAPTVDAAARRQPAAALASDTRRVTSLIASQPMFGLSSYIGTNAVEILKQDHDDVEKLFDQYEDAKDEDNAELKAEIVAAVCKALTIHAQIEEELFYPAMRRQEEDAADLVDEAAVEHQTLKNLVAELLVAA